MRWIVLLAGLLLGTGAAAGHVFFFQIQGDWAVTCDRDLASGRKTCRMSAPPPALGGLRSSMAVTEEPGGLFRVAVRVPGHVDVARPFLVAVDGAPQTPVTPSPFGEAAWAGLHGTQLVDALAKGRQAVLYFGLPGGEVRSETFSLAGFPAALALLRENLLRHGVLAK
ncbi:MAG: invasion associated locus B family protein [Magnetospirillum sp. WYHS-4]